MTKEQLIALLLENASEDGGHEIEHENCDEALLDYINDEEVSEAYHKGTKWYS